MGEWKTESLRLTVFLSEPVPSEAASWWRGITGQEPEARQSQPRLGITREVGPVPDNNCNLELQLRANRVDWTVTPFVALDQTLVSLPNLGRFSETLGAVRKLLYGWLGSFTTIKRLAFGAVLLHEVPSHEEGYRYLDKLLPFMRMDLQGARDFMLQINRPRESSVVRGLELNRLSKWSVASITGFELGVVLGGQAAVKQSAATIYANRLELDLSTAATWNEMLKTPIEIVEELISLGLELAEKGEVR